MKCNDYANLGFSDSIVDDITNHVLECDTMDDRKDFFEDLIVFGCENGITDMFAHNDRCKEFYIEHVEDMDRFMTLYENETGIGMVDDEKHPRYVQVCWFCYEELGRNIFEKLSPEE